MVVQLLLQGMKPARFRDAVKLQLAWRVETPTLPTS